MAGDGFFGVVAEVGEGFFLQTVCVTDQKNADGINPDHHRRCNVGYDSIAKKRKRWLGLDATKDGKDTPRNTHGSRKASTKPIRQRISRFGGFALAWVGCVGRACLLAVFAVVDGVGILGGLG